MVSQLSWKRSRHFLWTIHKKGRGKISVKLTLWNSHMKETEVHFSQTHQTSRVLAILQQYNNPFGSVTLCKDHTSRFI